MKDKFYLKKKKEVIGMYQISQRNDILADQLVNSKSDMMFAGVVAGHNPGYVWVNNRINPSSA